MHSHFLKLNRDKTEVLVLTKPSLRSHAIPSLSVDGLKVCSSECVTDLGVHYDTTLRMENHIRAVCKKTYYQIHLIHKVRRFITEDAARTLVNSNVTTLIDYCNGLLFGLPSSLLNLLQRVQNSAARVIKRISKSCHITPVLKELHWLPVKYRVEYKIILLTFKALNGFAPSYICDLLQPYRPTRSLRSATGNLLVIPSHATVFGGRAFEVCAPNLWNSLPLSVRQIKSVGAFKSNLKTHFFKLAFT